MYYWTRTPYTETDKALMWERWRAGESTRLRDTGRMLWPMCCVDQLNPQSKAADRPIARLCPSALHADGVVVPFGAF